MRRTAAALACLVLLSGCGSETHVHASGDPVPGNPTSSPDQAATAVLANYAEGDGSKFRWGDKLFHFVDEQGEVVDAAPWTACLGNGCYDGAPGLSGQLPHAGSPEALYFAFDYPGWSFRDVSFNPVDEGCRQWVITVKATQVADQVFRIDPAGVPGPWRVDVVGRGPEGDAVTSILWDTPAGGTKGDPATGVAAVLAEHDGTLDSYGVELSLTRLDRAYRDATATITVASASGRSLTVRPHNTSHGCGREGDLFFTAPDDLGRQATQLGKGPFTYTAEVHLGPTTYTGTGTYPDDVVKGNEPNIRLTWDPPLPSYAD